MTTEHIDIVHVGIPQCDEATNNNAGISPAKKLDSHLEELRQRLIVCLLVFVPLFGVGMYIYQTLWRAVIFPLERVGPGLLRFQALGPSDGLLMAMRIAFAFAFFASMPVWLGQALSFISPGLTDTEKRWLYLGLGSGNILFLIGVIFSYMVGVPFALGFLLPFNQSLSGWENAFTGTGYVDFVITSCAAFGVAFELPLVMLILGWFSLLTPEILRKWWRAIILGIVVLAALATPPDPVTQILLAGPMLVLFLIGCWLVRWCARIRRES